MESKDESGNAAKLLAVVLQIPKGSVGTYGQIAKLAGLSRNARQVGTVLNRLPEDSDVPWHRVVNAQGKISDRGDGVFAGLQRQMLESEGIEFDDDSKLNLSVHQWRECD
jgi:methylated-DNA-protein-cysteine methyltransferase related protein